MRDPEAWTVSGARGHEGAPRWARSPSASLRGRLCRPRSALAANQLLEGSRLLTCAGWGHLALRWTPCIDELVGRYLVDGTLPPEGTVCPPLPNPFLP